MTLYGKIALVTFVGLLFFPRDKPRRPMGSAILGVAWPILVVTFIYLEAKRLKGRHGFSELELVGCFLVGALMVPVVLFFMGDPLMIQAYRSIRG